MHKFWWFLALLLAFTSPVAAQQNSCEQVDLALVLAVDVSESIDQPEYIRQNRGYAAAFRDPRVIDAITSGLTGCIEVAMIQWSSPELIQYSVKWTFIYDEESSRAFAGLIEQADDRWPEGETGIGAAINFSLHLLTLSHNPIRKIIDVSGDGPNNTGPAAELARDQAIANNVVVNGLPLYKFVTGSDGQEWGNINLEQYYKDYVTGGPGSFVIIAADYATFAEAVIHKLILEIAMVQ